VLCYRAGVLRTDVPFDAVDGEVGVAGGVVWLDIEHPDAATLDRLQDELQLHPLSIQDLRLPHQRPKVDEYDGLTMVVLFAARLTRRQRLHLAQVAIFAGPGYIVTVHRDPVPALVAVQTRWQATPRLMDPHPHELLLYRICEALVEAYFPLVDTFDTRIEHIEDRLFRRFDRALLKELLTLRRDLTELRRVVAPPRDVFTTLSRHDDPNVGGFVAPYFMDLVDLTLRLTDTIDTMRDRLGTALDSYLTLQSNALNETMKRLTALTVIFTIPMIVTGMYGMNFDNMPELHWQFGYPFALLVAAIAIGAAVLVFKRKDWL
jgi:magnesium transporter